MDYQILKRYELNGLVRSQTHPILPLIIWNYTEKVQYESLWDEVTLMCRGLVTWTDTGEICARPFRKFFNLEEGKHTPTSNFEVFEKIDGSLIIAFFVWDRWFVASRGSFVSDQAVAGQKLLDSLDTSGLDDEYTYLFELTAPWNRIVVDYGNEDKLTLLGSIRTHDGQEMDYEILHQISKDLGCDITLRYDGILDYSELKGKISDNAEGFVVRFSNGNRVKIKGEEYLRLHRIMTCLSTTAIWEVLSNGGDILSTLTDVPDEFYDKIHQYSNELMDKYISLENEYHFIFKILGRSDDFEFRAGFAERAKRYKYPAILFKMYDDKDYSGLIWKLIRPEFSKL
jgi:T4 RnlA family RNA ligase